MPSSPSTPPKTADASVPPLAAISDADPREQDAADPWLGRVLDGRYRVLERLGQGGMGTVYVAEHLTLHKQVALKLVTDNEGPDSGHARRFVREAMVTSLIDHPNVISALDFGTFEDGTSYLAMNLVRGPTLGRVLRDEGCLTWARAAEIGAQVADALCAAQSQNIVHRDLKPDNVILQRLPDGKELVKLLDFGIAKHTRDSLAPPPMRSTQAVTRVGVVIGTLGYMAPEQAVGKRADHRSDLYGLGALLWECVVGRKLWAFDDVQALLAEQLNKPARSVREASADLTIPDSFDSLVAGLLAINPSDRPQSPAEVRDSLRVLVAAVKQGTLQSPPRSRPVENTRERLVATRVARSPIVAAPSDLPRASPVPGVEPVEPPPSAAVVSHSEAPTRPRPLPLSSFAPPRPRSYFSGGAWLLLTAALVGAGVLLWTHTARPATPAAAPVVMAHAPSKAPSDPNALAQGVRPLLSSLVEGGAHEERVVAAKALLRHVPVDEVPAYARSMALLQLADTCAQKKQQLSILDELNDPRTLPVLQALAQRKRAGCGPKGKADCLVCLRDELETLVQRLEAKQLNRSRP